MVSTILCCSQGQFAAVVPPQALSSASTLLSVGGGGTILDRVIDPILPTPGIARELWDQSETFPGTLEPVEGPWVSHLRGAKQATLSGRSGEGIWP